MEQTHSITLLPNGRIWMDTTEGAFLGYGRIELLEKIKAMGSIRKAALDMKMSYRQAWQLVEQINAHAQTPLVVSHRGGKGGGQALLTDKGEKAILQFHKFNDAFQAFLKGYCHEEGICSL